MIRIFYLDQESGSVREGGGCRASRDGADRPYCLVCRDWRPST